MTMKTITKKKPEVIAKKVATPGDIDAVRALEENVTRSLRELGSADLQVAQVEAFRAAKRQAVAMADTALKDRLKAIAADMGVDLTKGSWNFDLKTGTFEPK